MTTSIQAISIPALGWALVPAAIVAGILYRWSLDIRTTLYAVTRMLVQLLLIGYALKSIFAADHAIVIVLVLTVMLSAACWIALRPLRDKQPYLYRNAFVAIGLGSTLTLALVTQLVLEVQPWFLPRYVVPLAGMVFASAMNAVSLAAERFEAESKRGRSYGEARNAALQASLIPVTNSLFAVGLVSLPGMMTGQILSGISPLVAVKYQIVIMGMAFGVSGIASALYLALPRTATVKAGTRP